jgi:hypothetical protein
MTAFMASLEDFIAALFGEIAGSTGVGVAREVLTPPNTVLKALAMKLIHKPRSPPIPTT